MHVHPKSIINSPSTRVFARGKVTWLKHWDSRFSTLKRTHSSITLCTYSCTRIVLMVLHCYYCCSAAATFVTHDDVLQNKTHINDDKIAEQRGRQTAPPWNPTWKGGEGGGGGTNSFFHFKKIWWKQLQKTADFSERTFTATLYTLHHRGVLVFSHDHEYQHEKAPSPQQSRPSS